MTVEVAPDGTAPAFRAELSPLPDGRWVIRIDGKPRVISAEPSEAGWIVDTGAARLEVAVRDGMESRLASARTEAGAPAGPEVVRAPMPGIVTRVAVAPGQEVAAGALLAVLEAMKMANEVLAPRAGRVSEVAAVAGCSVAAGEVLVRLA